MMEGSKAYIAGVGTSRIGSAKEFGNKGKNYDFALTAATKALLDAGITYTDVNHSVICLLDDEIRVPYTVLSAFGMTGASISEVDISSALSTAVHSIGARKADCALLVGYDMESSQNEESHDSKIIAVAIVLISDRFLSSHVYLNDTAIWIRAATLGYPIYSRELEGYNERRGMNQLLRTALEAAWLKSTDIQILDIVPKSKYTLLEVFNDLQQTDTKVTSKSLKGFSGSIGLVGLVELVWQLRGWHISKSISQAKNALQLIVNQTQKTSAVIMARADGKSVPQWKTIEHLRDGRERLYHNPAQENKKINLEDWEAVRADDAYLPRDAAKKMRLESRGGDRAQLARLQPKSKF